MKKSYSRKFSVLPLALTLCATPALATPPVPTALPTGGQVTAGQAAISQSGSAMTINQATDKAILNWQSFNIGSQAAVRFNQPSTSAVALNRVVASEASQIYGQLTANGQVYLVNPAGIVFGPGSRVDVGGLVASTLDITDADFLAGRRTFSRGNATGAIVNQGEITAADGGLVALLAPTVVNEGVITARLGNVTLAAGDRITLDGGAGGLLQLAIDPATLQTLIDNRQLIVADGGQVVMTSKAADALSAGVVANSGTVQARTLHEHEGRILLLADMEHGETKVDGVLDASAPFPPLPLAGEGTGVRANGGFVETSAARVRVADSARVTTLATNGANGTWLLDPDGFTIAASGGDMTGAAVATALSGGNFSILSTNGSGADGNINVNDTISWNANKLTLTATNDINVNAVMTASGTASLDLEPGSTKVNMGLNGAGFYGRIDFPGRSGVGFLTINGAGYTVINSLGAQGSVTATDLQGMNGNLAGKYALGANIDASATSGWNAGAGFVPIGTGITWFSGIFDGLGHTINGLVINRSGTDFQGLFEGPLGATIHNIGLEGGSVTGRNVVGGLAGSMANTVVSNSYSTATVSGTAVIGGLVGQSEALSRISNSYATGNVTGSADWVGGLVGFSSTNSVIAASYATGAVSGGNVVGGLVGHTGGFSPIDDSYATGVVTGNDQVGGLVGWNSGSSNISRSYATGTVIGATNVGGLVGSLANDGGGAGTVTASYWNTQTTGQATSDGGTGLTTAQMQQQASFAGWDFTNTWRIYEGHTAPLLRDFLTPLTVTASNDSKAYNGVAYFGGNGVAYSIAGAGASPNLLGVLSYSGTSQGAINAGSYGITPAGLYSNQQGYDLSFAAGTLTITAAAAPPPAAPAPAADNATPNSGVLWRSTRMREPEPTTPPPPADQPITPQTTAPRQAIEVAQVVGTQENRLLAILPNFIRLQEE